MGGRGETFLFFRNIVLTYKHYTRQQNISVKEKLNRNREQWHVVQFKFGNLPVSH